jgi:streptogrisin C
MFSNNNKLKLLLPLIISILMIVIGASNIFGADITANNQSQQINPTLLEAEQYAKHFGTTVDEALARFQLMRSSPELENVLEKSEPTTFGGLWIQHEPEFKIFIAFTHDWKEILDKYITPDLPYFVEVRTVNTSYAELKHLQDDMIKKLNNLDVQFESGIGITKNRVEFKILESDKNAFMSSVQNGVISIPEKADISYIHVLPREISTVYGGLVCQDRTTGFAVKASNNTKGFVSCYHGFNTPACVYSAENDYISITPAGGAYVLL